uniref:Uncharacterized protein n=1 Tax=Anguilla anguilla TaxID=7936 RepID=A0A0E9W2W9_ANGAN
MMPYLQLKMSSSLYEKERGTVTNHKTKPVPDKIPAQSSC